MMCMYHVKARIHSWTLHNGQLVRNKRAGRVLFPGTGHFLAAKEFASLSDIKGDNLRVGQEVFTFL